MDEIGVFTFGESVIVDTSPSYWYPFIISEDQKNHFLHTHTLTDIHSQVQINKIRNSVKDRQSQLVWQIVNEVSGRKITSIEKLNAISQEGRLQKWKEHFNNLPEITDKPTLQNYLWPARHKTRTFCGERTWRSPEKKIKLTKYCGPGKGH